MVCCLLASVIGMSFALSLEHVQGLEPCPLCVFQRIGLIGLGIISLIALIHNPASNWGKRLYALLGSTHQFYGQLGWLRVIFGCKTYRQIKYRVVVRDWIIGLKRLPLKSVFEQVLTGSGECAKVDWTFLGSPYRYGHWCSLRYWP